MPTDINYASRLSKKSVIYVRDGYSVQEKGWKENTTHPVSQSERIDHLVRIILERPHIKHCCPGLQLGDILIYVRLASATP